MLRKFINQANKTIYGPSSEASLERFNELTLEELKTIKLSPETATVEAESDEHYSGEYKE